MSTVSPQRKKLAPRNKNLVDSRKNTKKEKLSKNASKSITIFKDQIDLKEPKSESIESALTSEKTSPNYWKDLAEERRIALEKALEENKDLSELLQTRNEEKDALQEENETLLEENSLLREKAQRVNELESLLAEILPSDETEAETEETQTTESDTTE